MHHFHCRSNDNQFPEGALIQYGVAEAWKVKAAAIGRTKPTRALKPADNKKNDDGRLPDTIKELMGNKSTLNVKY